MSDNIDRSGWDPKKCWARNKKSGSQCGNYPLKGGAKTCRFHGSSNRRSKTAAARNLETEKAQRLANRLGAPIKLDDPSKYILDLIATKAGEVEWLRHQVELLEDDEVLWWGKVKQTVKSTPLGDELSVEEAAQQHIIYTLLHKAQDQLARYASDALKAGVEERQVKILEDTGKQFMSVIQAVLDGLDLSVDQSAKVPELIRDALLAGGGR